MSVKIYIVTIIEEEKQGKKDVSLEISFHPSKKVEEIQSRRGRGWGPGITLRGMFPPAQAQP